MKNIAGLAYHSLFLSTLGLVACGGSGGDAKPKPQLNEALTALQGEFSPTGILCDGNRKAFPNGDGAHRSLKIEDYAWNESSALLTYKDGVEFTRNTEVTSGVVVSSDPQARKIELLTTGRTSIWQMSGKAPESSPELIGPQKPFTISYRELGAQEIALTSPTGLPEQLSPLMAHLDASCADYAVILKRVK